MFPRDTLVYLILEPKNPECLDKVRLEYLNVAEKLLHLIHSYLLYL
jgi:hypothetical protein